LTALLAIRTLLLAKEQLTDTCKSINNPQAYFSRSKKKPPISSTASDYKEKRSFGDANGAYILCVIVTLLLVREIFYVATIGKKEQLDEKLFYPLSASTEFLAVVFFAIPGLVPPKADLPTHSDNSGFSLAKFFK
jgi:hypothetical protein